MKHEFSLKKIIQLTFPSFLSQATLMLVGIVDMYFAGTIGTSAISALAIAHTTWNMVAAFFEGLRLGTTVIASRYFGAQRHEDMYHVGRIGLAISAVMGAVLIIFGKPISVAVYSVVVKDPEVQALGVEYLPWILASGGFVFTTFVIDGMFRSVNRVVIPTLITLITQSVNIGLNCVFVWGMFGIQPMGIKGIALATFIAYVIATIFAVAALYFKGFRDLFKRLSTSFKSILGEYFSVAASVGLHSGFRLMAMLLFTKMLGSLGSSSIASFQIASQVFQMSYIPGIAFMITMSMLVGRLMGASQTELLWHVAARVAATALTCAGALGVFVFYFAQEIAVFFSPNDLAVATNAAFLIKIVAINQFIVMLNFMFRGYLNGVKQTTFLMIASVVTTYGVFLPLSYIFAVTYNQGLVGAYAGVVTWNIVDTLVNAWRSRMIAKRLRQEKAIAEAVSDVIDEVAS